MTTREYWLANKEKMRAQNTAWCRRNAVKSRAKIAKWLTVPGNRERAKERSRKWREANRERFRQNMKDWRAKNPEKQAQATRNAKARKRLAVGSATAEQVAARVAMWGGQCWMCSTCRAEEIDHTIPLSKGGSNWASNLRPACRFCNNSKNGKFDRAYFLPRFPG